MEENLASYEVSSFTIDASNLHFDEKRMIVLEDFPAFVHEWWHYIQDITTISGQIGFYLWFRDVARMTKITCNSDKIKIHIPLTRDEFDEVYSKYRKLYNIFCGSKKDVPIENAFITKEPEIDINGIAIDGEERKLAKCNIYINNCEYYFGLIALQELNAFYAQKIIEGRFPKVKFNINADDLPDFPYKVGDLLFDYYKIKADLKTKFIISTIVQDTLQAPAIFLLLLKELKGRNIDYANDREEILKMFYEISKQNSYPNSDAYQEWGKDYSNWLKDSSHEKLREALCWYINRIYCAETLKDNHGLDTLPLSFVKGSETLKFLYSCFPAPLIKIDETILSQDIKDNEQLSKEAKTDYDNAIIIWAHRRVYDLLKSNNIEEFQKNSVCQLYNDGKCDYLKNYKEDKRYDCKTAPWMVVKGETKALCPYAIAAHSMGIWQNDLEIYL